LAVHERSADELDTLDDCGFSVFCFDAERTQVRYRTCAGDIIYGGACGIAESSDDGGLWRGRSVEQFSGVVLDGFACFDVFVDDESVACVVGLDPQANERIDVSKVERTIQRQCGVIRERLDVNVGVEFVEDDIFEVGTFAEHFSFEACSARAFHHRDAIVDGEISVGAFCFLLAVDVERALGAVSVGAFFYRFPDAPFENRRSVFWSFVDCFLH